MTIHDEKDASATVKDWVVSTKKNAEKIDFSKKKKQPAGLLSLYLSEDHVNDIVFIVSGVASPPSPPRVRQHEMWKKGNSEKSQESIVTECGCRPEALVC